MAHLNGYRPDSVAVFNSFWMCWRLLGVLSWQKKDLTVIHDIVINLIINIWYPVHLTVGLILLPMHNDIYKNMSMTITCIVCTMKHYCIRRKLKQICEMRNFFSKLDKRAICIEERKYFVTFSIRIANLLVRTYFCVYMGANVAALLAILLDPERRLMYPAWFPFNWSSSSGLYYTALIYQFVGVTILIVINFTNDALAPVTLCLFSGQVHLLAMRVSKLGYDKRLSYDQHEHELKLCIADHINLIKLFNVIEDSLSYVLLILFISSSLNICVVLIYLFFFVENVFVFIYYTSFLMAICVELFPIFYFGSLLQEEFYNLPYAIFSSNWLFQKRSFRLSVCIFMEVALRKMTVLAGSIVDIHLDNFFAICKTAYSLFAVAKAIK